MDVGEFIVPIPYVKQVKVFFLCSAYVNFSCIFSVFLEHLILNFLNVKYMHHSIYIVHPNILHFYKSFQKQVGGL